MKTLLLLRHAKSSWKSPGLADHDRPLNKRGERDAPRMGRLLRDQDLLPDVILSSTAERARRTLEALVDESGYAGDVQFVRDLYAADPETCLEILCELDDSVESVMLVGHNPCLEDLLELLTGESERLPTAALVQISLPVQSWQALDGDIQGQLANLWLPRELDS